MCGLAGVFGGGGLSNAPWLARSMGRAIDHRGPDGSGCLVLRLHDEVPQRFSEETLAGSAEQAVAGIFVHRRLAILDLVSGDQPMASGAGDAWIVFNGEIYNYRQLRAELAGRADLKTCSDTEVILETYRRWGVAGFARLNGMFAFALYDVRRKEVVLARDPIGIKPLYWGRSGSRVWFASELRAPRAAGLLDARVSDDALLQYLYYRFVPAPATLLAGAHKVMPGSALRFSLDGTALGSEAFAPPPAGTGRRPDAVVELSTALGAAVSRQLVSDVPVGAFLSGGVDSSLVVELMRQDVPDVVTFAVGFPSTERQESELVAARRAALALNATHHERTLEPDTYFDRLPGIIAQVEEPLAHPGMLLQSDLAALARQRVKVVLTGQGADEPLGGYPRHHAARLAQRVPGALSPLLRRVSPGAGAEARESIARMWRLLEAPRGIARATAMFSPLSPSGASALLRRPLPDPDVVIEGAARPWWEASSSLDPTARMLWIDTRMSLADDLLLVTDKTAMAHSLEARVPFLDLDYLGVVESIEGAQRVQPFGRRKHLQYALATRLLPPGLSRALSGSSRPWRRKRGFDVPVTPWLRGPMRSRLEGFLLGADACLPEYLDEGQVRTRVRAYLAGGGRSYRFVLSLLVLEIWFRIVIRGDDVDRVADAFRPGTIT